MKRQRISPAIQNLQYQIKKTEQMLQKREKIQARLKASLESRGVDLSDIPAAQKRTRALANMDLLWDIADYESYTMQISELRSELQVLQEQLIVCKKTCSFSKKS